RRAVVDAIAQTRGERFWQKIVSALDLECRKLDVRVVSEDRERRHRFRPVTPEHAERQKSDCLFRSAAPPEKVGVAHVVVLLERLDSPIRSCRIADRLTRLPNVFGAHSANTKRALFAGQLERIERSVVLYFVAPAPDVFDRVEPVGPERLKLEAKFLRISEGEAVTVRYPRSARFGVEPVRERLSKRVHPASGSSPGFEYRHIMSRLSKLICSGQT